MTLTSQFATDFTTWVDATTDGIPRQFMLWLDPGAEFGLMLRADLHLLFDSGLITVNQDDMTIEIAPELRDTQYRDLDGVKLKIPDDLTLQPSAGRLNAHRFRSQSRWRT